MASVCEVCGKNPSSACRLATPTAAPSVVGTRTSSASAPSSNGTPKRLNVCTGCIKAGKVVKARLTPARSSTPSPMRRSMQGVIKAYDPATGDGVVICDTDLAEYDLAADALEGSVFRMLRRANGSIFDLDDAGRATRLRLGSEVDMGTPGSRRPDDRHPRTDPDLPASTPTSDALALRLVPVIDRAVRLDDSPDTRLDALDSTRSPMSGTHQQPATRRTGSTSGQRSSSPTPSTGATAPPRSTTGSAQRARRRAARSRTLDRGQAAEQLLGALRPRRRRPGRGPHVHLLASARRRRPDQQLARPGRDARRADASSTGRDAGPHDVRGAVLDGPARLADRPHRRAAHRLRLRRRRTCGS